jgi:hypothetical protein
VQEHVQVLEAIEVEKKTCRKFSTHRIHVWYIYMYIY